MGRVPEPLVLLHGFGGTHRAWDGVTRRLDPERYLPIALDLPGHGDGAAADAQAPAARDTQGRHPDRVAALPAITFASCVAAVLAAAPERFVLCGYSLGGRIALHVALAAPDRVGRLVLVSCSAGIADPHERARRRESDRRLARELEDGPYEHFIESWRAQPRFAADPPRVRELALADQRRNDPRALAAVLRGVGAGEMQPLWERLGELTMPATVAAGARDAAYREIALRMSELLPAGELRVLPGGHVLPLESPGELAEVIATGPLPPRSSRAP
jgi:2-succinyl-6-hydroxy-2,4-cyclohexadiene-1-carboxylate synthase